MPPASSKCTQLRGEIAKRRLRFCAQSLAKNLANLCLSGVSMPRGPTFQPSNQIVIEIADAQTSHVVPIVLPKPPFRRDGGSLHLSGQP
jgi:hypothetical protein